LNYLGISYGTFLGATYANLFPHRVGRLVLDGNVPPGAWTNGGRADPRLSTYLRMGSDEAATKALAAFLSICGQRSTQACAFSAGSPAATRAKWDALLARLRKAPINLGGTAFTYADVVTSANTALAFVQPHTTPVTGGSFPGWPQAAQGLQQLWLARNAKTAARPDTPPAAAVAAAQPYGGAEQTFAVQCNEAPSPSASAYPGLQRLVLHRSGVIGLPDLWTFDEPCATWPVRGHDTYTGPWNAPTSPILVIGNTTDPFLPLRDAIAMTRQLANARLLVVHGYGHTAFLNPSTCANNYMTAYFQTGALPRREPHAARTCRRSRPRRVTQPALRRVSLRRAGLKQASRPLTLRVVEAAVAGSWPPAQGADVDGRCGAVTEEAEVVTSRNPFRLAWHAPVRAPAGPGPAALRSWRLHLPRGFAACQFAPGVSPAPAAAAGGALGFVPRSALVGYVRRTASPALCRWGAACPG
jgi:pimeloyl-ACP methyl ester carboxylesterase